MKLRKDRRLARRKAEGKKKASSELKPPKHPRRRAEPGDPWDAAPSCKSCATFLRLYSSKMAERFSAKVVEHLLRVVIAQTKAMKTKIRFPSATHCQAPNNASCRTSMGQKADSRTYIDEYVCSRQSRAECTVPCGGVMTIITLQSTIRITCLRLPQV